MNKFKRKDQAPLCACGCGEKVKRDRNNSKWNCFVRGHNWNNRRHTYKTRTKMSIARKKQNSLITGMSGKNHSEETKQKLSIAKIGKNNPMYGKILPKKHRQKISKSNKNKTFSKEHRKKLSILATKRTISKDTRRKISKTLQGRKLPIETIIKMSGSNYHFWKGGIAAEPYCDIWLDKEYKKSILERDNNECQNPDCWRKSIKLNIHHIDYVKKNCHPKNLITVCISCNSRANSNRKYWTIFYRKIMAGKYKYEYSRNEKAI